VALLCCPSADCWRPTSTTRVAMRLYCSVSRPHTVAARQDRTAAVLRLRRSSILILYIHVALASSVLHRPLSTGISLQSGVIPHYAYYYSVIIIMFYIFIVIFSGLLVFEPVYSRGGLSVQLVRSKTFKRIITIFQIVFFVLGVKRVRALPHFRLCIVSFCLSSCTVFFHLFLSFFFHFVYIFVAKNICRADCTNST